MTLQRLLTALAGAALAASCATVDPDRSAQASRNAESAAPAQTRAADTDQNGQEEGVRFGALQQAALPEGSCGMLLWTLDGRTPQAVFRYVSGDKAEAVLNGAPVRLSLASSSGAARYGVAERLVFSASPDGPFAGAELSVDARFGLGFDGGHYLESGLLAVSTPDGWRTVAPVAGLAGCRA